MQPAIVIIFTVLLVCAVYLGWFARKWIERFENMERIVQRRDLPNTVKAGLEDINALAGMSLFESADNEKLLIGLLHTVVHIARRRSNSQWFDQEIERISALLRKDPKGYDADEPMKNR